MDALQEQLQYYKAGEKVKITIQTQNKNGEYEKKDVEVTLGKQSDNLDKKIDICKLM